MISKWKTAMILLLLLLMVVSPAQASEGYVVSDIADADGYHVTTLARPNPFSVGKVNLFIRLARVNEANQERPVSNAQIQVQFVPLTGPGADKSQSYVQKGDLVAGESEPGTYEVADSIQNEGLYRIVYNITEGGRKTQTGFEIQALPQPDDRLFGLLLLSLIPIGLLSLVWLYMKPVTEAEIAESQAEDKLSY